MSNTVRVALLSLMFLSSPVILPRWLHAQQASSEKHVLFKPVRDFNALGPAPEIGSSVLLFHGITLSNNFTDDDVLYALFPGDPQADVDVDSVHRIYWRCSSCMETSIPGKDGDVYLTDSNSKDTRFLKRLEYHDDSGRRQIFITTYTSDAEPDGILVGRFQCAILTLALFSQNPDSSFTMTAYAPMWDCTGQFCSPNNPRPIEVRPGGYAFNFPDWFQAGGAPMNEYSHIAEQDGTSFRHILEIRNIALWNLDITDFRSTFSPIKTELHNNHYDLLVTTKGKLSFLDDLQPSDLDGLPAKLLAAAGSNDSVEFEWDRIYRFSENEYRPVKHSLQVESVADNRRKHTR